MASLSPAGPFSRLPFPRCAPERWGHAADPASAWGVSEGMLRSGKGRGETQLVQADSHHLLESLPCCSWTWGTGLTWPPGVGLHPLKPPNRNECEVPHQLLCTVCGSSTGDTQNHTVSQRPAPRRVSDNREEVCVHHGRGSTAHNGQHVETTQCPPQTKG